MLVYNGLNLGSSETLVWGKSWSMCSLLVTMTLRSRKKGLGWRMGRDIIQICTYLSNQYWILPEVIWRNLMKGDLEPLSFKAESSKFPHPS